MLESSTAASLPGWAGPERTGDTGTAGDKGCCVCAEQQVPVAPGCHRQPRRFPALALPFLKIVFVLFFFFSGQEEFEALLRSGQGCATVLQCQGWVMPRLGDARVAVGTTGCCWWLWGGGSEGSVLPQAWQMASSASSRVWSRDLGPLGSLLMDVPQFPSSVHGWAWGECPLVG